MKSLIRPQGVPYIRARVKTMPVMKKEIELEETKLKSGFQRAFLMKI